ncbi:MAG: outer membrane protein assembly factor BamD [candidate division Zixibacteria bacterium]|nr:outer membrane protein assembly factor BamD [candidate division Zixibacteria bacterium]
MNRAILTTIILFLLLTGCSSTIGVRQDTAEGQYEKAMELYNRGKYYHASEAFRLLIFNFSGVSYIDSVQYYLGMCYFNDEDYILAVAEFRRLVRSFPNSPLADDGQLTIGKCYFLSAPRNTGLDQSDTYMAINEVENFIEDFPLSPLQSEAADLLAQCRARIAKKTFKNGEQYYKIGNYESARIYLEQVVTEFESPEWRGCALFVLAVIDEKQKKYDDSASKFGNFIETFPGHKWEKKAKSKLEDVQSLLGDTSVVSDSI